MGGSPWEGGIVPASGAHSRAPLPNLDRRPHGGLMNPWLLGASDQEECLAVLGTGLATLVDMGWGWGHHGWWAGGIMMFAWLLFIGAVIFTLARAFAGREPATRGSDAEQILAARYARGEIDETEYRARRAVLKEHR